MSEARRSRSWRFPVAVTAAVALAMLAAAPAVPGRSEIEPVPLMGTTTVVAPGGVHGLVFSLPADASWQPQEDTTVHPFDGEYATVIGYSDQYDRETQCIDRFCSTAGFTVLPDLTARNVDGTLPDDLHNNGFISDYHCSIDGQNRCPLGVTEFELYIASDAPISFTIRIPELTGEARYEAIGTVEGEVMRLPDLECPGGDCERWSYGGVVGTAGTDERPGIAGGVVYARTSYAQLSGGPPASVVGTYHLNGCTYPSFFVPSGSPDPAAHPLGCDFTPTVTETLGIQWDDRWVDSVVYGSTTFRGEALHFATEDANGEVYAGFHARNHHVIPRFEGAHGAYAYWITQGIYQPEE